VNTFYIFNGLLHLAGGSLEEPDGTRQATAWYEDCAIPSMGGRTDDTDVHVLSAAFAGAVELSVSSQSVMLLDEMK
jgi:hypothetical protein